MNSILAAVTTIGLICHPSVGFRCKDGICKQITRPHVVDIDFPGRNYSTCDGKKCNNSNIRLKDVQNGQVNMRFSDGFDVIFNYTDDKMFSEIIVYEGASYYRYGACLEKKK